jgi:hypothetical protein
MNMRIDIANDLLTEASLIDFKRKMGGNPSAGNDSLKIGVTTFR